MHSCPTSRTSQTAPSPETNICPSSEQTKYCTSTWTRCPSVKDCQNIATAEAAGGDTHGPHPHSLARPGKPLRFACSQTTRGCAVHNPSLLQEAGCTSGGGSLRLVPRDLTLFPAPPRALCPAPAAPRSSTSTSVARPTPCPCCWRARVAAAQPFPTKQPRPLSHPPAGAFPVLGRVKGEAAGQN